MLYVRKDAVGRGRPVSLLYRAVQREARERVIGRIITQASVTARPFFERRGFRVVRERRVARRGVQLTNFAMEKPSRPPDGGAKRAPRRGLAAALHRAPVSLIPRSIRVEDGYYPVHTFAFLARRSTRGISAGFAYLTVHQRRGPSMLRVPRPKER
jgi:hypothetical protein